MQYFSDKNLNDLAWALRNFAEEQARLEGVPYWKVLRNKVIVDICKKEPLTIEALSCGKVRLGGVKTEKYGAQIVAIVKKHCEGRLPFVERESPRKRREEGVMYIKQGGFYYNVSGNDALLLHKHFCYKLYGVKTPRTGFPVVGEATVLKKLDALSIDYDLLNQAGEIVASKRFENNLYEIVDENILKESPELSEKKPSFKERAASYIEILQGLSEGVDTTTGEIVEGLTEDTKLQLFEMSLYFDERLKARERLEEEHPQNGQKWTEEEDEALLAGWQEGKTVKELAQLHARTQGAIRSRLMKIGVQIL